MYDKQQFNWVMQVPLISTHEGGVFHNRKASLRVKIHLDDFFAGIVHLLHTFHKDS